MTEQLMTPGQVLRDTVAATAIQVPGAPNALVGRLIEEMGFSAMYLSGAALSAASWRCRTSACSRSPNWSSRSRI